MRMDGPTTTRYSLIAQLVDHDDHVAWSQFLDLYQPLIYRFALSRGLQPTDATEVTQEVLIRVARAIEQFQHQKAGLGFRQWLYTIAGPASLPIRQCTPSPPTPLPQRGEGRKM